MPEDYQLTKYQRWGLGWLRGVFAGLQQGQLPGFVKGDELASILRQIREGGFFGGKIPDGEPGSEFTGTGSMDPLDLARYLFRSLLPGMGERDGSGGVDPATRPDDQHVGTLTTRFADGSVETFTLEENGRFSIKNIDAKGNVYTANVTPHSDGSSTVVVETRSWDGHETRKTFTWSPGEDGSGDGNTGSNPLIGINVMGPQSNEQAISALQNPGKDSNELDPNSGLSGFKLTEAQQERLGRTVPALDVLDPNSGKDPLSQLNLDPNQIQTRSEEDDRIDPNTGLGFPVGGRGFDALLKQANIKTDSET